MQVGGVVNMELLILRIILSKKQMHLSAVDINDIAQLETSNKYEEESVSDSDTINKIEKSINLC